MKNPEFPKAFTVGANQFSVDQLEDGIYEISALDQNGEVVDLVFSIRKSKIAPNFWALQARSGIWGNIHKEGGNWTIYYSVIRSRVKTCSDNLLFAFEIALRIYADVYAGKSCREIQDIIQTADA